MRTKILFSLLLFINVTITSGQTSIVNKAIHHPIVKWKFQSDAPIRGGVAIKDDNIYFGNGSGNVYCLDKNTGKYKWIYKTNYAVNSTPAVANDMLYVSNRQNMTFAINRFTGKLMWEFKTNTPTLYRWGWDYFISGPVVKNKIVYIGSGDNFLYALNTETGKVLWKFKTGNKIRATPLINGDDIYVPAFDGIVYVLNATSGKLLWTFETDGAHMDSEKFGWDRNSITSKPALADSLLVFGSRDGSTYCVNIFTHKRKWRFTYGPTWALASPCIDNNIAYIGWSDNSLFSAIDLQTGKEKWKYNCGGYVYSSSEVDNENVYTGSGDGNLYALNKTDGMLQWQVQTNGAILSSILLKEGILYAGNDGGALYAVSNDNRSLKAVYLPSAYKSKFIEDGLSIDNAMTPYFVSKGFKKIDSAGLVNFLTERIKDKSPSVIVFAHQYLPDTIIGVDPSSGLMRRYMEAGGKIVWPGEVPRWVTLNAAGRPAGQDKKIGTQLLDVDFDRPDETGNYFATANKTGLQWGLPKWFMATNSVVTPKGIVPLAFNELGRVGAWYKKFGNKPYSGFIACRTWSYNSPVTQQDLDILLAIANYGF